MDRKKTNFRAKKKIKYNSMGGEDCVDNHQDSLTSLLLGCPDLQTGSDLMITCFPKVDLVSNNFLSEIDFS